MAFDFHQLASAHGLGDQASILQRYLKPSIGFSLIPGRSGEIGCSRLGGGPDVPADFDWPTYKKRRLDFLLQVNLADIAAHDAASCFPKTGLLSYFYDLDEQPWINAPEKLHGFSK